MARSSARRRPVLVSIVALVACGAPGTVAQQRDTTAAEQPAATPDSCECHPQLVGKCFPVHGTLALYKSAPTARILIAGTKRVLGLRDGLPEWLEEALEGKNDVVVGDFVVCPFTRPKRGAMPLVCIESASNMVVKEKN